MLRHTNIIGVADGSVLVRLPDHLRASEQRHSGFDHVFYFFVVDEVVCYDDVGTQGDDLNPLGSDEVSLLVVVFVLAVQLGGHGDGTKVTASAKLHELPLLLRKIDGGVVQFDDFFFDFVKLLLLEEDFTVGLGIGAVEVSALSPAIQFLK